MAQLVVFIMSVPLYLYTLRQYYRRISCKFEFIKFEQKTHHILEKHGLGELLYLFSLIFLLLKVGVRINAANFF